MIFRPDLAVKVVAGTKTVTRRLCNDRESSPWWVENCGYRKGQVVAINPGRGKTNIGHARITSVTREPLEYVTDAEAQREGFANDIAFADAFREINGRFPLGELVWRLGLKPFGPVALTEPQERAAKAIARGEVMQDRVARVYPPANVSRRVVELLQFNSLARPGQFGKGVRRVPLGLTIQGRDALDNGMAGKLEAVPW